MLALSVVKKVTSLVNALMLDLNVVAVAELVTSATKKVTWLENVLLEEAVVAVEIPELVSNAVNKATCLVNALKEEVVVMLEAAKIVLASNVVKKAICLVSVHKEEVEAEEVVETEPASSVNKKDIKLVTALTLTKPEELLTNARELMMETTTLVEVEVPLGEKILLTILALKPMAGAPMITLLLLEVVAGDSTIPSLLKTIP